jgi:hydrogenase maturation protease
MSPEPALVLAVGNPFRRDDGAGPAVARALEGRLPPETRVRIREGDLAAALDDWDGAGVVVAVDAARSGAPAGTLHRHDAAAGPLPAVFARGSTHAFGLAEAVELARALGRLPRRLVVFAIEGREFGHGDGLTPEVAVAVGRAADAVLGELAAHA